MNKSNKKIIRPAETKGQVSSFDIIISVIIFTIIFVALRGIVLSNITSTSNNLSYNEMQIITQQAIEGLTETYGYPKDWNTSSVELIGLEKYPGVLDTTKVTALFSMDYNKVSTLLALGKYEYHLTIKTSTKNYSLGSDIGAIKITQKRIMDLGGEKADVTLAVFNQHPQQ